MKNIGQLVIAKDLDEPLYHFAVVIDDIDMAITHVIRGEEHISNTPKQLLIYEALGATPPQFAHLPLMLGEDRSKLSKRNAAVSITEYQKDYLPEAFLNFIGSLSYTFEPEMLTREEMVQQFELSKMHKSGAVFDVKKLNWFNSQYIKRLTPQEFKKLIGKPDLRDAAVPIMTERLERLSNVAQFSYLWERPEYDRELLRWKNNTDEQTRQALEAVRSIAITAEQLDALTIEKFDGQKGSVYWPLRVALSGQKNSAGPLDIAAVLDASEVMARIDAAIQKLQ
jgi:nondiscriminating glutamyl-tRNA synthetase